MSASVACRWKSALRFSTRSVAICADMVVVMTAAKNRLNRTAAIIIRAMRLLTGLLLVVAVSLSHLPVGARATPAHSIAAPTIAEEIQAMETRWNEARAHADVATLDRILVDDWTVTHANGTTDSKRSEEHT